MNIAVIGLGYWGPNIVRNLLALDQNVTMFDRDVARTGNIQERFPACHVASSLDEVLSNPSIAAIAVAVPLPAHCDLVIRVLQSQKHIFVEKPLCASIEEADAIRQHLNGTVLMVAHITQFSKGVERLTDCIRTGTVGELRRLSFVRTHLGPVYKETDVLTEVAAHDAAIVTSLIPESPAAVNAWGVKRLGNHSFDAAHIVLQWENGYIAQIDVQWSSALRRRIIEVEGTLGTLCLRSDTTPEELTWYDHKAAYDVLTNKGHGTPPKDLVQPQRLEVPCIEPLREELAHFLTCIENRKPPKTDFAFSRRVVNLLEAARRSMLCGGARIELS